MAQMCLVKAGMAEEGCIGTLRTPLMPRGGLMSSVLLTGFRGELSWEERGGKKGRLWLETLKPQISSGLLFQGWAGLTPPPHFRRWWASLKGSLRVESPPQAQFLQD